MRLGGHRTGSPSLSFRPSDAGLDPAEREPESSNHRRPLPHGELAVYWVPATGSPKIRGANFWGARRGDDTSQCCAVLESTASTMLSTIRELFRSKGPREDGHASTACWIGRERRAALCQRACRCSGHHQDRI